MSQTAQEAYNEILAHIKKQGGSFSSWYCGITKNVQQRLHGDHNVPQENHWFIHRKCISDRAARSVEKAFLEHGCDGGGGGSNDTAIHVYAYLKTSKTDP